ncbi:MULTISPECIES: phage portal protein [Pseudomonas]|uniref:Phage portal protein n=1 Tax=Pseudomonas luteola TaxID=47886 RepID=A0ABS0FPM9_PSELU|nr:MULTISPECIES: phage portal protein [Pseudomonas]MBF8642262.1 phage portal protein [Pseudomonas zeshuii]RRW48353.1 phage portal protein [Pseudomonas luteola]
MRELEAQAKALGPVLKGFVDKAAQALRTELFKSLDEREEAIRTELNQSLACLPETLDAEVVAKRAAGLVPTPQDGKDGKDADPETIKQMVEDAVASLPPPTDGKDGLDGKDGVDGKDGQSVPIEEVERMVQEAVAKAMQSIELPKDGKDGEPGRDAVDIEILPAIDESKSYARGTYATHKGGLWRSYERTVGLKGWECIVEGIADLRIEQDGDRGFKAIAELSSGAAQEKALSIPAMVYRGIFKAGEFQPGDTVTWGGSLWHCDEPTSDKPGEPGSKGWRLAVKRGRDGKDGLNGKDLIKGVTIK